MIQDFIKKVGEFHDVFGVECGNVDVELRYKLFKEEFEEYKDAKTLVDKADAIVDMLYIACGTLDIYERNYYDSDLKTRFSQNEKRTLESIDFNLNRFLEQDDASQIDGILCDVNTLAHINGIKDKLPQLFEEVHLSNLSKLDENGKPIINDGILDPNKPIGKILKGKNYFEPRLKEILENGN